MMLLPGQISGWILPLLLLMIPLIGYLKGVKIYDTFVEGAAEGVGVIIKIFPYLLAMMVSISIFRNSGALAFFVSPLSLLLEYMGIELPEEVLPLFLLRPLSGSGSLAYIAELLNKHGPDSFTGKLASTIQGSTETTFYIVALYFGALGIRNYRYSVFVGIMADIAGFLAAIFICKLMF